MMGSFQCSVFSFQLVAFIDDRLDAATKLTDQASGLGGNVFVVTLVLLIVAVYLIAVVVPNARSQRANTEKLTEVIATVGSAVTATHEHATIASDNSTRLVTAMKAQTRIAEKINDAGPKCDIKGELGEIRGALAG